MGEPRRINSDRDLGRLEGKVDGFTARLGGVERRLDQMSALSSAEHAEVRGDLRRLADAVDANAERQDKRIDSVEKVQDEGHGRAAAIRVAQGFAFGLVPLFLYILDQGGAG